MKKFILLSLCLVGVISLLAFRGNDRDPQQQMRIHNPPVPFAVTNVKLIANTINTWFRTNGSFNYDPFNQNNPGFEWPKRSGHFARFASGLWLGAVVGNDTLVAISEYSFEYLPGYTDNNGNPQGKDDPLYKMYRICKGGPECTDQDALDRASWPNALLGNSDQNAPVYFDSSTMTWKPLDMGTQTVFGLFTDSYPESHTNRAGSTRPLKADIQMTNFAFDANGPLGQLAFTQWVIINRSTNVWNDAYLTAWTDDDLGLATNDRVGVDTLLGLGYTWNGDAADPEYQPPPAVGFDFFRGAIIHTNNPSDTALVCKGSRQDTLVGYKQLGLTVFKWYSNDGDPIHGNPATFRETYRYMSGFDRQGNPMINPVTNQQTKFQFSGDPVTGTGWVQPDNNDQRFMQSTGPFAMNPGDTQTIVLAQLIAQSTSSNLASISLLRSYSLLAQKIYDNCFQVPTCAPPPTVSYYAPGNGKIYLTWDDADEKIVIPNKLDNNKYLFQGYNVYQIRAGTNGSNPDDRKLLATFDVIDSLTDIRDSIVDEFGVTVYVVVQKGYNNGIRRYLEINKDEWLNQSLINGTPYYFSVTAYHVDPLAGPFFATSRFCESSVSGGLIRVVPQRLTQGSETYHDIGDTLFPSRRDLGVVPVVIEPLKLLTGSYTSTFQNVNDTLRWHLVGPGVDTLNKDFSGSQDTLKPTAGFLAIHHTMNDSGVIKDPTDPLAASRDIHTVQQGWDYTPLGNRCFGGLSTTDISNMPNDGELIFPGRQFESRSMSISFPNSANYYLSKTRIQANGPFLCGQPNCQPPGTNPNLIGGPLRTVRIVFSHQPSQQQMAYRYIPTTPLTQDTLLRTTAYQDYINVPFTVWDVDPLDSSRDLGPRQLNCAFVDADNNGQWDPDTSKYGKFQILYIFASTYSSTPLGTYTARTNIHSGSPNTGFPSFDIMYVWVPKRLKTGPQDFTDGDVLTIYPYIYPTRADFVPGYPISYSWSVQGSIINNSGLASQNNQMDKVKVFPNPYYGQSRLETDPVNRFIYFSNLPKECTIYIYTLNGVLIRKISRNVTDPRSSLEAWDLRNDSDIPVASGMYIALVDAPGIGTKVLKFAIFTPEERIDTF